MFAFLLAWPKLETCCAKVLEDARGFVPVPSHHQGLFHGAIRPLADFELAQVELNMSLYVVLVLVLVFFYVEDVPC